MYVPAPFNVSDKKTLERFIDRYDFATMITASSGRIFASHIPLMFHRSEDKSVLLGHVARANDHWKLFDGTTESLAIFHGPHAYVSPTWYTTSPSVPTWNYAAVHVYGKPRAIEDHAFTTATLSSLVSRYESTRAKPWTMDSLESGLYGRLAKAIVAFEMPVNTIEGKFKLGQNRSREDRMGMLEGLMREESPQADALADFLREHAAIE